MKKAALKEKQKSVVKIGKLTKKWLTPILTAVIVILLSVTALVFSHRQSAGQNQAENPPVEVTQSTDNIQLPVVDVRSNNSLEAVLKSRHTRLDFNDTALTLKQVSQLLWAGQGINTDWGDRTASSFKSTYPLTLFLIANKVDGLDQGEYQYLPGDRTPLNQLKPLEKQDFSQSLFNLLNQSSFKDVPAVIVVSVNLSKMAEAYGGISHDKEAYLEAGFVAQNISLQAESLKLGTTVSTNFDEMKLRELIVVSDLDNIVYLMPVGVPK